ncbi:Uncharacterized conserved protein YdiU, UPF0061 family [Spirosomataceae bacterium TFI 002]|nr:Uncharacterized conserved protein YdiU, UPF0061 family [Spirosomataceae bacterium TFI 002]
MSINMELRIKDTFNKELPADPILENSRRQVKKACFSFVSPKIPSNPKLIHVSNEMANEIGLNDSDIKSDEFLAYFSGLKTIPNSRPYAMCYGGHQFGNWAGQLGDGRAINLAEVEHKHKHWALQLKGAGATPYSRTADGLAVLRSSIREHLCSEAMFHLGVPTTRSLSLALTGDQVLRDVLYDGNPAYEKGAVVCRVAPSFIRFGNFEIFSSREDAQTLKQLTDFTIKHFYQEINQEGKDKYLAFFQKVVSRSMKMVLDWQRVGFVHGVMNTDNMSILGLTIDYGPYGWMEDYDPSWTPNTTDRQNRRYRFGNQPRIVLWNLVKLANALYPLVEEAKPFEEILEQYQVDFQTGFLEMMRSKLGLKSQLEKDQELIDQLDDVLRLIETDMTIFFRLLSSVEASTANPLEVINEAFYKPEELDSKVLEKWEFWMNSYQERLLKEGQPAEERIELMRKNNPKYVLRNYMAQLAIDKADEGDYSLIAELHEMLKKPYDDQIEYQKWFAKRPDWARVKVGCSMLSCSS